MESPIASSGLKGVFGDRFARVIVLQRQKLSRSSLQSIA
jgi:hypothetical protein